MRRKPLTTPSGAVRELTRAEIRQFKPADQGSSRDLLAILPKRRRGQRGPQQAPVKRQVTLRLDSDVVAFYKATGPGWQTRVNRALREAMRGS